MDFAGLTHETWGSPTTGLKKSRSSPQNLAPDSSNLPIALSNASNSQSGVSKTWISRIKHQENGTKQLCTPMLRVCLSWLLIMDSGTPDEVECCWRVDKHRCGKILPEVDLGPHLAADHDACGADTRRLICMWIILTKDGSQSLCGASFRRDNLKRHMAIHLGNQKYECSICQRTYSRADTLKGHYKKSH